MHSRCVLLVAAAPAQAQSPRPRRSGVRAEALETSRGWPTAAHPLRREITPRSITPRSAGPQRRPAREADELLARPRPGRPGQPAVRTRRPRPARRTHRRSLCVHWSKPPRTLRRGRHRANGLRTRRHRSRASRPRHVDNTSSGGSLPSRQHLAATTRPTSTSRTSRRDQYGYAGTIPPGNSAAPIRVPGHGHDYDPSQSRYPTAGAEQVTGAPEYNHVLQYNYTPSRTYVRVDRTWPRRRS